MANSNFIHKISAIITIFIYFLVFSFAIASIFLHRAWRRRKLRHISSCKSGTQIKYICISLGIYNILLGFTHRVLIGLPSIQLYVLIFIQIVYLSFLIHLLSLLRFKNLYIGLVLCCMNGTRILFILTHLVHSLLPNMEEIISQGQKYLFYSNAALCMISAILYLGQKVYMTIQIFKSRNKVKALKAPPKR